MMFPMTPFGFLNAALLHRKTITETTWPLRATASRRSQDWLIALFDCC